MEIDFQQCFRVNVAQVNKLLLLSAAAVAFVNVDVVIVVDSFEANNILM